MAIIYVRSTDGSDSDNGSTWALAKATLAGAGAIDAAGDTVYVSQNHAESSASLVQPPWNGTAAAPIRIICADDSAEPPTQAATGASVTTTGASDISLTFGSFFYHGITFNCGTGTGSRTLTLGTAGANARIVFESCNFNLVATGSSGQILLNGTFARNCGFSFSNAGQFIQVSSFLPEIRGGSILAGSTSPTFVFNVTGCHDFLCEGFDFSNCSAGVNLVNSNAATAVLRVRLRNCKLPASWSGALVNNVSTMHINSVVEMINCSAGAVNYAYRRQTALGSVAHETTIVKSGGASDGVTPISWKLVSLSPVFPSTALESENLYAYNSTVGGSVTATVEIVTDGVTLKDDEIWLDVEYLGSSSQPLATNARDRKSDPVASGVNQSTSSVTWTTTGLASPVKQKLEVTFTPQMAGYVIARVLLAKPSTTVYVDPTLTLA